MAPLALLASLALLALILALFYISCIFQQIQNFPKQGDETVAPL